MSLNTPTAVAAFVDWDNLDISTKETGRPPDARAIVEASRRFGEVVVARAYSEWPNSAEQLAVYLAGLEPAYAPVVVLGPEANGRAGSRRSLADACLIVDCVDLLHHRADVGVVVLVSGDKDLCPLVRLARARGRRVVVIGPTFTAAILRDLASEFIPYSTLVGPAPAGPEHEGASDVEVVRFILGLRPSQGYLTYRFLRDRLAERPEIGGAEPCRLLERLKAAGVLRVDAEPTEVRCGNGERKQVVACSLVEDHPLVQALRAGAPAEPGAPATQPEPPERPNAVTEAAPAEPPAAPPAPAIEPPAATPSDADIFRLISSLGLGA